MDLNKSPFAGDSFL
uniref:Uncharacterized protein n=1 Tax=Anguilla anguilla TaxID=7936 RepID=A0A0E9V4F5_ANGAN